MATAGAPAAIRVVPMTPEDWPEVRRIYEEGIDTGQATFETAPPDVATWDAAHLRAPRLVARLDGRLAGWAALSPVSPRRAYRGVAEVSLYVDAARRSEGVGAALLRDLIRGSDEAGLWTLQAVTFPENGAAGALLRRCGFREVGRRERIARLHGEWRDTLLFERRSDRA